MRKQTVPFKILSWIFLALILLFILAPIGATILFSFDQGRFSTLPLRGFTTKWYQEAFSDQVVIQSLLNSVVIAVCSSAAATALGFLASFGMRHWHSPLKSVFMAFSLSAMAIPWTILGLALLIYYKGLGIHLSNLTVCISHVIFLAPLAMSTIHGKLKTIPYSVEDAALDLGANDVQTLWYVILPQAFPAVLSAMLLCFTLSFDEFIISWFVCGFDTTLPVYLFQVIRGGSKPTISAIGSVIFGISMTMNVLSQLLSHKKEAR